MPYHFVRSKEFVEQYKENNPGKDSMLWMDILNEAVNASGAKVLSVGYDGIGEPVTMLLKGLFAVQGVEAGGASGCG